ncbi:MAG: DUF4367 domain-containing protein [Lachnospiraceae bacterium]|nr:DUF4367 domain-containing protein [Lachnospiraceae bacterium]
MTFRNILAEAVRTGHEKEILLLEDAAYTSPKETAPGAEQTEILIECAKELPEDAKNAFWGLYYFGLTPEDVTELYGVSHPVGTARYYTRLLSDVIGFGASEVIDADSMKAVSKSLLQSYADEAKQQQTTDRKHGKRVLRRVLRYAGFAAAVLVLGFSVTMVASAELRAVVLKWFFRDRVEYSEFTPVLDHELSVEEMYLYEPTYIPEGYILEGRHEESTLVDYAYLDKDDWYLMITISLPGYTTMIDTENAEIIKTEFRGAEAAIILSPDGYNHLICSIDEYPVYVSGRFETEELIKIAESIKKR